MARIQTAATLSQAGRIWAAAQNLAELLLDQESVLWETSQVCAAL